MASFHNIQTHYEHGIGHVRVVFVIADSYANLFVENAPETTIFEVTSSKKDLEVSAGMIAQDELQITCNEFLQSTTADSDAFALYFSSRVTKVYCAKFILLNSTTLTVDDAEFIGVLNADLKASAVTWSGDSWSPTQTPARIWNSSAKTFNDSVLDLFTVQELVEGKKDGATVIIPPISQGWIASNVSNKLGWYEKQHGSTWFKAVYADVVALGTMLLKLRDQFLIGVQANGISGYSLEFDDFDFDYEFVPTQFELANDKYELTDFDYGPAFINIHAVRSAEATTREPLSDYFKAVPTKKRVLKLFASSTTEAIHVDFKMFKPRTTASDKLDSNIEKMCTWGVGSFLDLIYSVAYSFGLYAQIYMPTPSQARVRFISKQAIATDALYIVGATNDSVNLNSRNASTNTLQYALSTPYSLDGLDTYDHANMVVISSDGSKGGAGDSGSLKKYIEATGLLTGGFMEAVSVLNALGKAFEPERTKSKFTYEFLLSSTRRKGAQNISIQAPFTISRTGVVLGLRDVQRKFSGESFAVQKMICLPANSVVFKAEGSGSYNEYKSTRVVYSGLYMYADVANNNVHNVPAGVPVLTPVAAIAAKINGEQTLFNSLTEYSNSTSSASQTFYETERTIEVPFLCAFSENADGTMPHWRACKLGASLTLDSVAYTILGITRNYQNFTTQLRLQLSSRFAWEEVGTMTDPEGATGEALPVGSEYADLQPQEFVANSAITVGDAVQLVDEVQISVERAICSASAYARTVGIALNSATTGATLRVALPTTIIRCPRYSFIPGTRLFVRNIPAPGLNISQSLLSSSNAQIDEQSIVEIGIAVAADAILITCTHNTILEELL